MQGFEKIAIEAWFETGMLIKTKHKCAQRVIDLYSVVMARRAFGCVRKESFTLVRHAEDNVGATFSQGRVELSIQFKEDTIRASNKRIQLLEAQTEHPLSAPMAERIQKSVVDHPDLTGQATVEDMVVLLSSFLSAKITWITKWGMPKTKFVDVYEKENAIGKKSWHFSIFNSEEERSTRDVTNVKASSSLLTISALLPDPKKKDYVTIRYQPRKDAEIVDLYFKVIDSPSWESCAENHVVSSGMFFGHFEVGLCKKNFSPARGALALRRPVLSRPLSSFCFSPVGCRRLFVRCGEVPGVAGVFNKDGESGSLLQAITMFGFCHYL